MPDLRNSTALRQLSDLGHEPDPSEWAWAVVRLDPAGRIALPSDARVALGARGAARTDVRGVCHRTSLVLSADGAGAALTVDGRARLCLPAWRRRGPCAAMVVGTNRVTALVVVAPATALDGLGDVLLGDMQGPAHRDVPGCSSRRPTPWVSTWPT